MIAVVVGKDHFAHGGEVDVEIASILQNGLRMQAGID